MNSREFQLTTNLLSLDFPRSTPSSVLDYFGGCEDLSGMRQRAMAWMHATQSVVLGPAATAAPQS